MKIFIYFLFFVCLIVKGSLFNGHKFPKNGPFFEAWYVKTIDFSKNISFASITANHLSETNKKSGSLSILSSLDMQTYEPMTTFNIKNSGFLQQDCHDNDINSNPDLLSPPCLSVTPLNPNDSIKGSINANEDLIEIKWSIKEPNLSIDYHVKLTDHELWDNSGLGPQGITSLIPAFGLYWYVFSLKSKTEYSIQINGKKYEGTGYTHIEKNWGDSFPPGWIWAEGIKILSNGQSVKFALAGGPKSLGPLPISPVLYLVGLRTPNLHWDFQPQDLVNIFQENYDSCKGEFNISIRSPTKKLSISIRAPPSSYRDCLLGPTRKGMESMCVESFTGTAHIQAFEFGILEGLIGKEKLIEEHFIEMSALEFGGEYSLPCFTCLKKEISLFFE